MTEIDLPTMRIIAADVVDRADGRPAMVLVTRERGPITFELTIENITLIRSELDKIEQILLRSTGRA
jgi:hypothetical protein